MSFFNVLCVLVLQIMWMCHQLVKKYLPEEQNNIQDRSTLAPTHSPYTRKRKRMTRFYAKEIEGSIVMTPVEEDMLRYSHTESLEAYKNIQNHDVLPTEYISRDVFTSAWLDSFSVTT